MYDRVMEEYYKTFLAKLLQEKVHIDDFRKVMETIGCKSIVFPGQICTSDIKAAPQRCFVETDLNDEDIIIGACFG